MKDVIVGAAERPGIISGSADFPCSKCGATVWISPSGQQKMRNLDLEPICAPCFTPLLDEEDVKVVLPSAADLLSDFAGGRNN